VTDAAAGRPANGADTPGPAPAAQPAQPTAARNRTWRRWLLVRYDRITSVHVIVGRYFTHAGAEFRKGREMVGMAQSVSTYPPPRYEWDIYHR
jgi:hypothetical protein